MQTETLNNIVRNVLINKGFPLHYYLPTLHRSIKGVRNISKDINLGGNIKTAERTISADDRVTYPTDCLNILKVYGLVGGKEKTLLYNPNITIINKVGGYSEADSSLPSFGEKYTFAKEQTSSNSLLEVMYDNYPENKYEYTIDYGLKQLVFGIGHDIEKVYMTYMSNSLSVTAINVVPYLVQDAIEAFVEYEAARNDGSPQSKVAILKEEFYTHKTNLRAAFNPMTQEDFLNYFK